LPPSWETDKNCVIDTLLVPKSTADKPKRRLLDQVRDVMRLKHYSLRTERTYCHWIERFIRFHGMRHPGEMAEPELGAFLTDLARASNVSASTQNQALSALRIRTGDARILSIGSTAAFQMLPRPTDHTRRKRLTAQ